MFSSRSWFWYTMLAMCICIGVTRVVADGLNPFIAPYADQVILVGQPFLIQWTPGTPGPVFIAILGNSAPGEGNITTATPNNGSYTWTPGPILAVDNGGENYFLQICDLNTHDCTYTYDGRFSLVNSTTTTSSSSSVSTVTSSTSSDTNAISTTSSATSATATTSSAKSVGATTTTPASSISSSIPSLSPSRGLSTGAQVAIEVVVAVVVTAALLVGGFFILRRRRNLRPTNQGRHSLMEAYNKPELPSNGIEKDKSGMGGPTSCNTYELSSNHQQQAHLHELATEYERPK